MTLISASAAPHCSERGEKKERQEQERNKQRKKENRGAKRRTAEKSAEIKRMGFMLADKAYKAIF